MQDFNDLLNGISDGTKDLSISALTCAGTVTLNGAINLGNATGDDITVTGRIASDFDPKTAATYALGDATQTWKEIFLDNGATDGGAVYFNASSTAFIKSDASAGDLDISGFTSVDFNAVALKGTGGITLSGISRFSRSDTTPTGTATTAADDGVFGSVETANTGISILSTTLGAVYFGDSGDTSVGSIVYDHSSNTFRFRANAVADVFRILPDGVTKIGVNALASGRLNVDGGTGPAMYVSRTESSSTNQNLVVFQKDSDGTPTTVGSIVGNFDADTVAYNTSSDVRLKTNFSDFDALKLLKQIEAVAYERLSYPGVIEHGVKAQDVYEVYPEAVSVGGDDPKEAPWCVDYSKFVPILIKAVNQLSELTPQPVRL